MMEVEKEKRENLKKTNQGTVWRSATTNKKIKGYSDIVLEHHKKVQPNLPPTTLILNTDDDKSTVTNQTQQSFKM